MDNLGKNSSDIADFIRERVLCSGVAVDNEYLCMYVELIKDNVHTKKEKFVTQKHHIIPKYYFKKKSTAVDDSSNNVVNLVYSDHILAHYYLCKCSSEAFLYNALSSLFYMLRISNSDRKGVSLNDEFIHSRINDIDSMYRDMRTLQSEVSRSRVTQQQVDRLLESNKRKIGMKYSEEWRKHISEGLRGKKRPNARRHLSEETKRRLSIIRQEIGNSHNGKIFINNGEVCKCVFPQDFESGKYPGYSVGRITSDDARMRMSMSTRGKHKRGYKKSDEHKIKLSKINCGKIYIMKGRESKWFPSGTDVSDYLNNGWEYGRVMSVVPKWSMKPVFATIDLTGEVYQFGSLVEACSWWRSYDNSQKGKYKCIAGKIRKSSDSKISINGVRWSYGTWKEI